jgi:carboxyl-terminal processing protease
LLVQTAVANVGSDPTAAFALSDQLAPEERRKFFDAVISGWANIDTEAALEWANQLSVPEEHDAALQAIHNVAPVGIGAALSVQNGYPVINDLIPGTPADLSGQLHRGDRIVGLAQGDNSFVDARNLSLQDVVQMIRGAPGTLLQLQVVSADAPPDSIPRTISIIRDQVKYKRQL